MPRLFVALDLPDPVKDQLSRICAGVPGVRWVKRDQMHLTLFFIGEVEAARFKAIQAALAQITFTPFEFRLAGVGQFPPRRPARVLWAGVEAPPPLGQLQAGIESALTALGLPGEDRAFSPHITLARLKNPAPPAALADFLKQHAGFRTAAIAVDAFVLYSSLLAPQGATYRREGIYRA